MTAKEKLKTLHLRVRLKLRLIREHYGLTRQAFADELQIPCSTMKNYELGYRDTALEVVLLLNESRFACHIPWLIDHNQKAEASGVVPA